MGQTLVAPCVSVRGSVVGRAGLHGERGGREEQGLIAACTL